MRRVTLLALLALATPARAQQEEAPPLTPPALKTQVEAAYPERAQAEGVRAEVVLEIDIDAEGRVEGARVVVPAEPGGYGFDEAALAAVQAFEFAPAREGDTPVPVRITYRYRFVLAAPAPAGPGEPADRTPPPPGADTPPAEAPAVPEAPPQVNLAGRLLERGTRTPLAGVTVTVFDRLDEAATGFEATTDSDGGFAFFDLAAGTWRILAEPEGYFPLRSAEDVVAGQRTVATYWLERTSYSPFDVLVEGRRARKEVSRTTIEIEEVQKIPGTFGDVLRVVENLPGVARSGPLSGDLIVRGSSPEDTQVYLDGAAIPSIYHFGGLRSVIPLGMLERLDFYPGNFSVRYGRATGGVVDVGTKRLKPERVGGYLDVSLLDAGALIEVPLGDDAAIAIAGRRSYVDAVLTAAVPEDAPVNLVAAPRYYDWQLLATWRPAPAHELSGFFFGSDDRLEILFDNPADVSTELRTADFSTASGFYRTLLQHRWVPESGIVNEVLASSGRNRIDIAFGDQWFLDLDVYNAQLKDTLTLPVLDVLDVVTGVDYLFTQTDARIRLPQVGREGEGTGQPDFSGTRFTQDDDLSFHTVAAFVEAQLTLWDSLLLVPGLRLEWFSRIGDVVPMPRLDTRLELTEEWTLKGGVGLFTQEPFFDETDPVFGNPDLGLESALHTSLGAEYRPWKGFTVDATLFYKELRDLVSRSTGVVERDGRSVPENYRNDGEGRAYGAELLIRQELARGFSGWLSYTLSRGERRDPRSPDYRLFDSDQTHVLTVLGSYQLPRNWSLGARVRYVSGNLVTPVVDAVYVADDAGYELVRGEPNSRRLDPFVQLDLRLEKRWVFDRWLLTAYLDLQNATNRRNVENLSYSYDASQEGTTTGLPILPVIGLRGDL